MDKESIIKSCVDAIGISWNVYNEGYTRNYDKTIEDCMVLYKKLNSVDALMLILEEAESKELNPFELDEESMVNILVDAMQDNLKNLDEQDLKE